jgi:hypothetical protein
MPYEIDHLLWGVPNLDRGIADLAQLVGVEPELGGEHPGFGTRNAILSLGIGVYLELIAPDPGQDPTGTRGELLFGLNAPKLMTFAMRTNDLGRVERLAEQAGLDTSGPIIRSRLKPSGERLCWRHLKFPENPFGEALPFFIDWEGGEHPSVKSPGGCSLQTLEVQHPQGFALAELYATLEIDVEVGVDPEPAVRAVLATPQGNVALT